MIVDPPASSPLRWISKDMLVVSALTLGSQGVMALAQLVFAAMFGASSDTDAYFAALAAPMYVTTVLVASLAVVFVPIFIDRRARDPRAAEVVASGAINVAAAGLLVIAAVGVVLADPIIGLTAPGLSPAGRELGGRLAIVLWPSVVGSGLVALLTALWQIRSRFGRSAAVPLVGGLANLALLVVLGPALGVWGAAVAWTVSLLLQAVLLAPALAELWRPVLGLRDPMVRAVFVGVAPLAAASVFIRASTVLERYLGSELPSGELSQLSYASRIVAIVGVLASAGPAAVLLPRMAEDVSVQDLAGLRTRASGSLRSLWIVVAPLLALLIALAEPGVRLLFEHGAFTRTDSEHVAALVRVYAPSVIAIALASVTGRAIYALRAVRVLALIGAIEGLLYIGYTTLLAHALGATGIALGFTIYFLGSLAWQAIYVRHRLTAVGTTVLRSLASTTALASIAGIAAWLSSRGFNAPLPAAIAGTVVGGGLYLVAIWLARPAVLGRLSGR